jgi:hypothetical protein
MSSSKKSYKIDKLLSISKCNRSDLLNKLKNHDLYHLLKDIQDIRSFMESHVFAVWDFMSLLKSLQNNLTGVKLPWLPKKNAKLTRFINEIVQVEESDLDMNNIPKSHFSMYLESMDEINADRKNINEFLNFLEQGLDVEQALSRIKADDKIKEFVNYTFSIIKKNKPHLTAAAFTYGREDVIPEIFIKIIKELDPKNKKYSNLKYYLDRHIEIDGDTHGPLALEMMHELCGDDINKWTEALKVGEHALQYRIKLWDSIKEKIELKNKVIGKLKKQVKHTISQPQII